MLGWLKKLEAALRNMLENTVHAKRSLQCTSQALISGSLNASLAV
jgi:hypothetical protein